MFAIYALAYRLHRTPDEIRQQVSLSDHHYLLALDRLTKEA